MQASPAMNTWFFLTAWVKRLRFGSSFSAPATYSLPPGSIKSACVSTAQKITFRETTASLLSGGLNNLNRGNRRYALTHLLEQFFKSRAMTHRILHGCGCQGANRCRQMLDLRSATFLSLHNGRYREQTTARTHNGRE